MTQFGSYYQFLDSPGHHRRVTFISQSSEIKFQIRTVVSHGVLLHPDAISCVIQLSANILTHFTGVIVIIVHNLTSILQGESQSVILVPETHVTHVEPDHHCIMV